MFGMKLRTWMESHIVRPRKKQQGGVGKIASGKGGKVAPERTLLDSTGNSPTSPITDAKHHHHHHRLHHTKQGVLRCDINYCNNVGGGSVDQPMGTSSSGLSSTIADKTMENIRLPSGTGTSVIGNNLSSPESAYSTGYSTDGTSPGASFPPPEYYVNIRTGTHYFHSTTPAGTTAAATNVTSAAQADTTVTVTTIDGDPLQVSKTISTNRKRLLHNENENMTTTNTRSKHASSTKTVKSLNAFGTQHRRTESCDGFTLNSSSSSSVAVAPAHVIGSPIAAITSSPRQRNRIRTNPWLATANGVRATNVTCATESSSSCSDGTLPRNLFRSVTRDVEECRIPEEKQQPMQTSKPPSPYTSRLQRVSSPKKNLKNICTRASYHHDQNPLRFTPARFSSSSSSSSSCSSRRSTLDELSDDDDLTLNEMLGKYDESYVYEKETDILSDSDPTDCEDDEVSHTHDEETGDDVGDEEELDFIDNGSLIEYQPSSETLTNRGHCTYYLPPNANTNANGMRRSRRTTSTTNIVHTRHIKRANSRRTPPCSSSSLSSNQRSKIPITMVSTVITNGEHREGVSLSKILRERLGPAGIGGSRSAGNTPVGGRKLGHETSYHDRTITKRRAMSISVASRLDINLAVLQADKEADLKYRQLILEAEHLLSSMTSTPRPPPQSLPLNITNLQPSLVTYKSMDTDPTRDGTYCPQSEPVKRKVYKCSPSFDKLQKSFEKSHQTKSLKQRNEQNENDEPRSDRASLKEKLEQLRRQRQAAEVQNLDDQRRISVARRQMLVNTIEGLKRSLEDQSAKLQETYRVDEEASVVTTKSSTAETSPSTSPKHSNYSPQKQKKDRQSPKSIRNSPKPKCAI